jgi:hypothetical protein
MATLGALALGALAASGACAAEPGNTAYTCLSGGTGFANADCSAEGKGFHDESIANNTPTQLTLKSIAGEEEQVFTATIITVEVKLVGTGVECMGCMAENRQGASEMEVFGSGGTLVYTGVTIPGMTGCSVEGTVTGTPTVGSVETEPLKVETVGQATKKALIRPVSTNNISAKFKIIKTGSKCNLAGAYEVTGDVVSTSEGAILNVNQSVGTTLKLGAANAGLKGKTTIEAGPTGGEHDAALLT